MLRCVKASVADPGSEPHQEASHHSTSSGSHHDNESGCGDTISSSIDEPVSYREQRELRLIHHRELLLDVVKVRADG